ncbi:UNVERIFIED_CONTAM: hypothetical protein H355_001126 [Colinus virginianus]|nr:hypothetical protein H355_001126 [Colinus virginianus]
MHYIFLQEVIEDILDLHISVKEASDFSLSAVRNCYMGLFHWPIDMEVIRQPALVLPGGIILAAGRVSWVTGEPTWSECIQTGVTFSEMAALFLHSFCTAVTCKPQGVLFQTLMVILQTCLVTMMCGETNFTMETLRRKRRLLDFIIQEHFPSIVPSDSDRYLRLQGTGGTSPFVAPCCLIVGVCNTDNFSLLSITIDYGPFGFMDSCDPSFVPNASDDEGRCKIGNQANVGLFNLNKLLQALKPLLDPRQKQL